MVLYKNIKFNKISTKDLARIYKWRNKKTIRDKMLNSRKITLKDHLKWFQKLKNDNTNQSFIIYFKNKQLGVASINKIDMFNKTCTWGFYIAEKPFRYLALLIEFKFILWIFEKKKIRKIWGKTIANNKGILRIHKYLGFKIEGIYKKHIKINNKYEDVILTSLFKEDWKLIKKRLFKKFRKY